MAKEKKEEKRIRKQKRREDKKIRKSAQQDERRKNLPNFVLVCVVVAVIIIGISTVVAIVVLCFMSPRYFDKKAEATLLASGLSIIGIAISVWAGLNIIQILGQDKLKELYEEDVAKYKEERYILNRETFLNDIGKHKDELNKYIHSLFVEVNSSIQDKGEESELFFYSKFVEEQFQSIYQQHYQKVKLVKEQVAPIVREIDMRIVKLGNSKIENKDIFINYFKLRKAEISFFLGYDVGKRDSYKFFSDAGEAFADVFNGIKNLDVLSVKYLDYFKTDTFAAFMINTMGEVYSKMLHAQSSEKTSKSKVFEENERMALGYYKILEEILSNPNSSPEVQREIYYRNHACLLERMKDYTEIFEDEKFESRIKELHQKAMEIALSKDEPTKIQVRQIPSKYLFKAWLQFYHRKMQYVDLLGICTKENETHKNYVIENMEMMSEYAERAALYAEIATSLYPNDIYNIKMWAFAERDLVLLSLLKGENARSIYLKFAERIRKMKLLLVNDDDYSRQLESEFLKITTLLKDYKTDKRRNPRSKKR